MNDLFDIGVGMLYISIPVHEQVPVIVNQCQNMLAYIDAAIVLHLSSSSVIKREQISNELIANGLSDRVFVNPRSMPTNWGSILHAHLANVDYIASISENIANDYVVFHASNDMLVRAGATAYVLSNKNVYHTRRYTKAGYYWPVAHAFSDQKFTKLRRFLNFNEGIIAGQIEGSAYPLSLLLEISKIISKYDLLYNDEVWYPREEVLLPTIALALGELPKADPYVFSELHRIDYWSWECWKLIDLLYPFARGKNFLKRRIHEAIVKSNLFSIKTRDVKKIINDRISVHVLSDGAEDWQPYRNVKNIFGVKRVSRSLDDPLRKFISRL